MVAGDAATPDDARKRRRVLLWVLILTAVVISGIVTIGLLLAPPSADRALGRGEPIQTIPTWTPPVPTATTIPTPTPSSSPGASTPVTPAPDPTADAGAGVGSLVELSPVLRVWASARDGVGADRLSRSSCLNEVAEAYAKVAAKASNDVDVAVPAGACGGGQVRAGFVRGFDESGAGQAQAALTVTADGPSPLLSDSVRRVGYAVVPAEGTAGDVNGYVLAWLVSK